MHLIELLSNLRRLDHCDQNMQKGEKESRGKLTHKKSIYHYGAGIKLIVKQASVQASKEGLSKSASDKKGLHAYHCSVHWGNKDRILRRPNSCTSKMQPKKKNMFGVKCKVGKCFSGFCSYSVSKYQH